MKTIGVLGGLGPQATMEFERQIHELSQRLISPHTNSGYPPMIVHYFRFPPMIVDQDSRPVMPIRPNPDLLQAVRNLGSIADFLVITANGPHFFHKEIEEASGRELLSMIEITLSELKQRGWQKVGLLALGKPRIYMVPLDRLGIQYVTLEKDLMKRLDRAIFRVMEGRDGEADISIANEAIRYLWDQGVEGIILGCTEIPLLLKGDLEEKRLIDPAQLLAEATVRYAMD